eukprot:TRINITY_DN9648_c0_g2_i2.p1 TRINITY_DN9648_c0_g2~~TRINITY_DN9648_c0_g2_i2.p1  ORF type:complete len:121 (+),score=0.06 TRINITY_DN9648_c0_g2_i2:58-420(+)
MCVWVLARERTYIYKHTPLAAVNRGETDDTLSSSTTEIEAILCGPTKDMLEYASMTRALHAEDWYRMANGDTLPKDMPQRTASLLIQPNINPKHANTEVPSTMTTQAHESVPSQPSRRTN